MNRDFISICLVLFIGFCCYQWGHDEGKKEGKEIAVSLIVERINNMVTDDEINQAVIRCAGERLSNDETLTKRLHDLPTED